MAAWARAAWRAARPPVRRVWSSSVIGPPRGRRRACAAAVAPCVRPGRRDRSPDVPAGPRRGPGWDRRRCGAGWRAPRRSAPGSAARWRSRACRRADDGLDLGPRGARQQRDQGAGAGGVADRADARRGRSPGTRPSTIACFTSMWLPKAPGEPDLVDRVHAVRVHQQPRAGVQRGLGELDRAHVVLGDDDLRRVRRAST